MSALVVFGLVFGVDSTDISTASTLLLAAVGLMILYRISKPMNRMRWTVFTGVTVGMLICIFFVNNLFAISMVSLEMRYASRCIRSGDRTCSSLYEQHHRNTREVLQYYASEETAKRENTKEQKTNKIRKSFK